MEKERGIKIVVIGSGNSTAKKVAKEINKLNLNPVINSKKLRIMKIIKRGEIKSKTINKKCSKCNTEFEYEEKDIKQDRDGKYVNCPVCKAFISAE